MGPEADKLRIEVWSGREDREAFELLVQVNLAFEEFLRLARVLRGRSAICAGRGKRGGGRGVRGVRGQERGWGALS